MQSSNELLRLKLIGRNQAGLFERLIKLEGILVSGYQVKHLYEVGGQSILYMGLTPENEQCIIKVGLLKYHRSAYLESQDIFKVRRRIQREAEILKIFSDSALPNYIELVTASNPLHHFARGQAIRETEPFLVIEYIEGFPVSKAIRILHNQENTIKLIETLAREVAKVTIAQFTKFLNHNPACLYSDLCPENLYLSNSSRKRIRILDASSVIPLISGNDFSPPVRLEYAPPHLVKNKDGKPNFWPDIPYVRYTLGTTLWEILTNKQPFAGEEPDLHHALMENYSHELLIIIKILLSERCDDFEDIQKMVATWETPNNLEQNWEDLLNTISIASKIDTEAIHESFEEKPDSSKQHMLATELGNTYIPNVKSIKYFKYENVLAIASRQEISLYDQYDLGLISNATIPHPDSIKAITCSPTKPLIVVWSNKTRVGIWDIKREHMDWMDEYLGIVSPVAISPDGMFMGMANGISAFLVTPSTNQATRTTEEPILLRSICVAFSRTKSLKFAVGGQGGIHLWDCDEKQTLTVIQRKFHHSVFGIEFTVNNLLAICWNHEINKNHIELLELQQPFNIVWQSPVPEYTAYAYSFSRNILALATIDRRIIIWDLTQYKLLADWFISGWIVSMDFNEEGKMLYTAERSGVVREWLLT